jgi:4-hydroxy-tetrahydrodipicolinate synthase
MSHAAREAGADGLLHVTPYYNRPSQEGCFRHFEAIAKAEPLPTIVYNVPGRTNVDLQVDTLARIAERLPNVVGVKEATGSVVRSQAIRARLGDRFTIWCGEDAINYPLYCIGAKGCISVVSNVAPALIAACWDAVRAGDAAKALAAHERVLPLADALFADTNPIPAKAALALMGRMSPEIRLPLYALEGAALEQLRAALQRAGLL